MSAINVTVGVVRVPDGDVDAWANDPDGPVMRDLDRRATGVQASMTRGCPRRTGVLASTIRKNRGTSPLGPHVDVIAGRAGTTDYLGYILNGTPPHLITPRRNRPNPHLRFMVGGAVVFARAVRHPGTRPNNFMLNALPAALD